MVGLVIMMFQRTRTKEMTACGDSKTLEVKVELHQVSTRSPFLFALVMDVLSEDSRNEELRELLLCR